MNKVKLFYQYLEDWLSGILIVSGLSVMLYQVFLRYVLQFPTTWQDEVSRYLIVWGVLIGSAVALRDNEHITIDILYDLFPNSAKKWMNLFSHIIMFFFFFFLVVFGFYLVKEKFISGQTSYSGFKLWIIYSCLPVSGLLMLFRNILNIVAIFGNKYDDNSLKSEDFIES